MQKLLVHKHQVTSLTVNSHSLFISQKYILKKLLCKVTYCVTISKSHFNKGLVIGLVACYFVDMHDV